MNTFLLTQMRNQFGRIIGESELKTDDIGILGKFPYLKYIESSNVAYAVLNNTKNEIEYHSSNFFDVLGLDKETFYKNGIKLIAESINKSHSNIYKVLPQHFKEYWENTVEEKRKDIARVTVGLNFNHIDRGSIRLVIETYILEVDSLKNPSYLFLVYHNISYMFKDNVYWIRFANLNESQKSFVYHDGLKEILKDDIISKREKEILHLIILGKSTEEIAKTLFISMATVNNHRQNMLNRVGVKDTTALISVAKLCRIV